MRALLRYAILKTSREQLLPALLFSPAVVFVAPMLGVAGYNLIRGNPVYPMGLDTRLGVRGSAEMMFEVVLLLTSVIGGIAAFRMFRSEVSARTLGFFYLATPPRMVSLAMTVYGSAVGTAAFIIAVAIVSIATGVMPQNFGRALTITVLSSACSSALGSLMLAISDDFTMLVPVCAGGLAVSVALSKWHSAAIFGAAIVAVAVVMVIAELVWRRRCVV